MVRMVDPILLSAVDRMECVLPILSMVFVVVTMVKHMKVHILGRLCCQLQVDSVPQERLSRVLDGQMVHGAGHVREVMVDRQCSVVRVDPTPILGILLHMVLVVYHVVQGLRQEVLLVEEVII